MDNDVVSLANGMVVDLPTPVNISYAWNFGSILGITFMVQVVSGILLSLHYIADVNTAFSAIDLINREINNGWILRYFHICGSSMFFLFMYVHVSRSLYYYSFDMRKVWNVGVIILLFSMAISFLGYVLPWGQMSYWGATVITNFLSVLPYLGNDLVTWIWGGFSVDYPTLNRFYSFHFLFPFILAVFILAHLAMLHETGSNNPLGIKSECDKYYFHPYYVGKDAFGILLFFMVLYIFFLTPHTFMEFQNFLEANSLVTPTHIQPEWYFLPSYAILRSVPNKLGGVISLVLFLLVYFLIPLIKKKEMSIGGGQYSKMYQICYWVWIFNFLFLIWLGACPVEYPFLELSRVSAVIYFSFFFLFFFF